MESPIPTLETELAEIAERSGPDRTAWLALRHWGWDGRGGTTLETAGREFGGISRERVRQLCRDLERRLRETRPAAPVLERALDLAADTAPTTSRELARRLADEHISAHVFDPAGLLTAAAVLEHEPAFILESVKNVRVVLPLPPGAAKDALAVITAIIATARAVVRRAGAARVSDVTAEVAADTAADVDDQLVTAVVSDHDDFVWLDSRSGWFYLSSVTKNAVISRVAKILSVAGAASLPDLHAGVRRDERMRGFVMPEHVLAELCERIPGVTVEAGSVIAVDRRPPEDVLESTELALVHALQDAGGAADRHELERACLSAGMTLSSFNNRVAYSPIITELPPDRVGLRGLAPITAGRRARPAAGVLGKRGPATSGTPRPQDVAALRPRPHR